MTLERHQHALKPNDSLHWYEIQSILGHGGFGITYIARDTNLDHEVAIKEYLPREFSTRLASGDVEPLTEQLVELFDWGKARFLEEARTLFQFKHENIVRVLSFFEANNTGYMVMEYERGVDLSTLLRSGEVLSEEELLLITLPILDGLRLVHDEGFIHRDIKPQNIVLRDDGRPVLIDFGSARQAMGVETRTLTALVTPGYTAIEQYHEAIGKQGPWTDIYALGATLYLAITGEKPADALKRSAERSEKKRDPYEPLVHLKADRYSEHFLAAIDMALEFTAEKRPQSLDQWSAMLQGIEPVPSADPTANIYLGPAIQDEGAQARPVAESSTAETLRPAAAQKSQANRLWLIACLIALGSLIYYQWDWLEQRFLHSAREPSTQPLTEQALEQQEQAKPESPETAAQASAEESTPTNTENLQEISETAPEGESNSKSIERAQPVVSVDLSGRYHSELSFTRNLSGVDQGWYFGEQSRPKIELQQIGNRIIGLIEGERKGRLEGTLRDNEISFAFNLLDPAGHTSQGRGNWFVSTDGKTMVGQWSLVNATDGSVFLEGDWTLIRLE